MEKEDRITRIEKRLRDIFNQDVIRAIDVVIGKELLSQWKELNNYRTDNSNPIKDYVDILDDEPQKIRYGKEFISNGDI
jgi:hypothetical protein